MFKKFQLKNGLNVLLVESRKSPVVSVQMWVNTGSADEKKGEEGISHFIEHLLFKGTRNYKVGEIAAIVEGSGGELNAYTSFDQTVFYVTISSQFIDTAMAVNLDMMGFPLFDETELENEKEVVIEEIKRGEDNPHRQASQKLFSSIYKSHPYGLPVIGYAETVRSFTKKQIEDYYHRRYTPENMTLVIVGDFDRQELTPKIKELYGEMVHFPLKTVKRQKEASQSGARTNVVKGSFEEIIFHLSWRVPKATHKDIPALDLLGFILGQGDSSRLMHKLRIESAVCKYAVASAFTPMDPGFFTISASLLNEKKEEFFTLLLQELERFLKEGPTAEEMDKAKVNIFSDELYALETVDGMARKFGTYEHLFKNFKHSEEFLSQVSELTAHDILKVAKKYLNPDTINSVLLLKEGEDEYKPLITKFLKRYRKIYESLKGKKQSKVDERTTKRLKWKMKTKGSGERELIVHEFPMGGRLILQPIEETPVVHIRTGFLGGIRFDGKEKLGVSELFSRTWLSATKDKSEQELLNEVESISSSISPFSGRNTIGLNLTTLTSFQQQAFPLFEEVLVNPDIPDSVVQRERQMMIEQLKSRQDNPTQVASLQFIKGLFGDHPYALDPHGDEESLQRLSLEDIENVRHNIVTQKNLVAVISGAINVDKVVQRFEDTIQRLPMGRKFDKRFEFKPPQQKIELFAEAQKEQSHVIVGFPGLTFNDPDRFTLQVMQSILAGQGGRLFLELRDKNSLAYTVSPLRMEGIDAGYFGAYIGCSPEKVTKSIEMMNIEFLKLLETKVPEKEMERAKRYIIGRHDIDLQRTSSVTAALLFDDIYGLSIDQTFHVAEKINVVSAADIQKMAQRIFSQPSVTSVVGPINPF